MNADALARLLSIARGEFEAVTATGRNGRSRVTPESPEITPLRPLRPKNDKRGNCVLAGAADETQADVVARLQAERGRINHWIADNLIHWPPSHCLHCRKPIIVGQTWTIAANGEVSARFHQGCHSDWLAQQEVAARRALGLA